MLVPMSLLQVKTEAEQIELTLCTGDLLQGRWLQSESKKKNGKGRHYVT